MRVLDAIPAPSAAHKNAAPWIVGDDWLPPITSRAGTGAQLHPARPPEPVEVLASTCGLDVVLAVAATRLIIEAVDLSTARDGCEVGGGLFGTSDWSAIRIDYALCAASQRAPDSMLPDVGALYDEGRDLERHGFSAREEGLWHTHPPGYSDEPSTQDLDFGLRALDVLGRERYVLLIVQPGPLAWSGGRLSWAAPAYAAWVISRRESDGRAVCERAAVIPPTGG